VKHSQVAGLAAGWLAVALSMAAIGTAAVNRVGMGTATAQVQVTVARSVTVGIYGAVLAPAQAPSSEAASPSAVMGESGTRTVSLTLARSAARTTSASADVQVPITVPRSTPASSSAAVPPVVAVPGSEALLPEDGTPTTTPTTTLTKAKPTKVTTPKKSTVINAATATADPSVVAVTFAAWSHPQGAIRAGCKGTQLAIVEPKPSDGYTASQRLVLIRSSITFDGPEKLSVLVSCEDGLPRFSTMR
jgi:hypothetical protein